MSLWSPPPSTKDVLSVYLISWQPHHAAHSTWSVSKLRMIKKCSQMKYHGVFLYRASSPIYMRRFFSLSTLKTSALDHRHCDPTSAACFCSILYEIRHNSPQSLRLTIYWIKRKSRRSGNWPKKNRIKQGVSAIFVTR